jgi:N-acetylmuramoyl-L-alanine amidase
VHADLRDKQLWGYRYEVTSSSLKIRVRRPPVYSPATDAPLKGLTIAVEAGHGGRDHGAGGVTGAWEKNINRMTADRVIETLTSAGAHVINIRHGDETVSLPVKASRAIEANADLFISVHSNSAGAQRGYLLVSGTSTYYKYSFSFDLADRIHARLLENLGIPDFGNIGNFNYYPLRAVTWMPSALVEQAFISNPADEAHLLDPAFRQKIADSVLQGIEQFLKDANEK